MSTVKFLVLIAILAPNVSSLLASKIICDVLFRLIFVGVVSALIDRFGDNETIPVGDCKEENGTDEEIELT